MGVRIYQVCAAIAEDLALEPATLINLAALPHPCFDDHGSRFTMLDIDLSCSTSSGAA
jgi:hypothetical protein